MFSNPRRRMPVRPGFALVATLSLMALLVVLAVGLLGLSAISLRGGLRNEGDAQARANARMALIVAIGELQRHAGPDARVTARADILDEDHPPVQGVWKSWEGSNHDPQGRPVSPRNYAGAKRGRFLGWLVSGDSAVLPDTTERPASVPLVGAETVGEGPRRDELQVHLEPMGIARSRQGGGGFAWWVSGENQKARLPEPFQPVDASPARWAVIAKSHAVADPAPFRMERLLSDASEARKTVSLRQGDLVAEPEELKVSQEFFHDLSACSVGLLTNTATGGWRKDLSLLTENWNQLPISRLPFFRVTPQMDLMYSRPTASDATAARSMLYPWSSYRGSASNIPIYRHGAVSSWENLKDYATAYKRVSSSPTGRSRINAFSVAIDNTAAGFDFLHKVRMLPVIARMQWVFSHSAEPVARGLYEPRLLLTPVITMWNPYSVELSAPALTFAIVKPLPAALQYSVNGAKNAGYNSLTAGSLNHTPPLSASGQLRYEISSPFVLKPGETRVFSPAGRSIMQPSAVLPLQQGYRGTGGHFFPVKNNGGSAMSMPAGTSIKADATFDTSYDDAGSRGVGIYLDMAAGGRRQLVYRMVYTPDVAAAVYQPLTQLAEATLGSVAANPAPFLSTIFGARMASRTHFAAKGFVQSSPLVNYTAMGDKDRVESTIARKYGGTLHPVNSPFDYSFVKHAPGGDSQLPNASDTSGSGYIVTGFNKSDGLSRCIIAEIPSRPLLSLAELQHWDLRYENPIPPFAFNLIGNSDASPLLPSNAVVNTADAGLAVNLQHDDSYCANHLLFDDWFFSSIAPDPSSFGPTGKPIQQTYTDFITGVEPLGNRAYRPITADTASAGNATALYNLHVRPANAYRNIASRLEVEGMFNVNSTSVTAWRALLGHARNQRVPYYRDAGAGWGISLSAETDYAFSRFPAAGDVEATQQGTSGAFPEAAEFAGYRILDDEMLDELALQIVRQVRMRGPFLSLAEFVNRQLASGDLALAGTIQAALNEMAKSVATNPYREIQAVVGAAGRASAVPVRAAEAAYQFPAAAEGYNAYGLPGWTRQADILRPIAPILSARDDTFIIRAYGEARDAAGKVTGRAVCEAVVRRTRDYVDRSEAADLVNAPASPINRTFGRRFEIESFRWLNPSEI